MTLRQGGDDCRVESKTREARNLAMIIGSLATDTGSKEGRTGLDKTLEQAPSNS